MKVEEFIYMYWNQKSVIFSPPYPHEAADKFDLGKDMVHNLAMIGCIPNSGIEQVRIHWLLDLVQVQRLELLSFVWQISVI